MGTEADKLPPENSTILTQVTAQQ